VVEKAWDLNNRGLAFVIVFRFAKNY